MLTSNPPTIDATTRERRAAQVLGVDGSRFVTSQPLAGQVVSLRYRVSHTWLDHELLSVSESEAVLRRCAGEWQQVD